MEVASLFMSNPELLKLFNEFIYSYDRLILSGKDEDTAYFKNKTTNNNEIFYHFKLNDVENEFSYNYSAEDVSFIRDYFKGREILLADISFKNSKEFYKMIDEFKKYVVVKMKENVLDMILSDPISGLTVITITKDEKETSP